MTQEGLAVIASPSFFLGLMVLHIRGITPINQKESQSVLKYNSKEAILDRLDYLGSKRTALHKNILDDIRAGKPEDEKLSCSHKNTVDEINYLIKLFNNILSPGHINWSLYLGRWAEVMS